MFKKQFHIIPLMILLLLLTACRNEDEHEKIVKKSDTSIESVLTDENFETLEEAKKVEVVEKVLTELSEEGAIIEESIKYEETEQLFTFEYSNGTLGGVSLKAFDENLNNNNISNDTQTQNMMVPKTESSDSLEALVLNAFENTARRRDFYEKLETDWEEKGMNTTIDVDVTIDDLKALNGYDIVIFAMHGGVYGGEPIICINQKVTAETDKQYKTDLDEQRIARVTMVDGSQQYFVFKDLFDASYTEIESKLIYSETCQFYGCDCQKNVDSTYANTLAELSNGAVIGYRNSVGMYYSRDMMKETVDNMLVGDVVSEALQKAIEKHGENDGLEDTTQDKYKAYPILTGEENVRIVEVLVEDFNIPTEQVITLGEVSVLEPSILPENASDYTITWTSSDESVSTVNQNGTNGIVYTKAKGETVVTATLESGGKTITKSTKIRVASQGRDTILVLDISGSMNGTPMAEMKEAAIDFCQELLEDEYNNRVGLVFYDNEIYSTDLTNNLDGLIARIESVDDGGRTNMEEAIATAKEMLDSQGAQDSIKNIVVMADGLPNEGKTSDSGSMQTSFTSYETSVSYANAVIDTAKEAMKNYNMYSLGFFHDLSGDSLTFATELMMQLTNQEDGYHQVEDAENLQFAFGDISEEISDGSKVIINIACPVDVTITYNGETISSAKESFNASTSFGNLQLLGSAQDIKVLSLQPGIEYDVQLTGTDIGKMNYSVNYLDENENVTDSREFVAVPITSTTIISSNTNNTIENMDLNIDENGDGEIDIIWSAKKNESGEITYDTTTEPIEEVVEEETIKEPEEPVQEETGLEAWHMVLIVIAVLSVCGLIVVLIVVLGKDKKESDVSDEIPVAKDVDTENEKHISDMEGQNESQTEDKESISKAAIIILSGPLAGAEIPLRNQEVIYIGKDPQRANVVFSGDFPNVSRLHCSVSYEEKFNKYFVTDCSKNGTFYAKTKERFITGKRTSVQAGTILLLGNDKAVIQVK